MRVFLDLERQVLGVVVTEIQQVVEIQQVAEADGMEGPEQAAADVAEQEKEVEQQLGVAGLWKLVHSTIYGSRDAPDMRTGSCWYKDTAEIGDRMVSVSSALVND